MALYQVIAQCGFSKEESIKANVQTMQVIKKPWDGVNHQMLHNAQLSLMPLFSYVLFETGNPENHTVFPVTIIVEISHLILLLIPSDFQYGELSKYLLIVDLTF